MKRFMLTMFVGIVFANIGFSQNVKADKYTVEDSTRVIISHSKNLYSEWASGASFSVEYCQTNNSELWFLSLCLNEGKRTIDKGRKMLLKFEDGSIIELENCEEIGIADYEYEVTSYGTNYYVYPSYTITEEQIQKIINGNVIKVRIEINTGYLDREIKGKKKKSVKGRMSEDMKEIYDNVKAASLQKKSIYDDF